MSSLQCPTTLLVAPAGSLDGLADQLTDRRVAWVWTDAASASVSEAISARLGVGVTVRADVAGAGSLADIADEHPGETVLVVSAEVESPIEVLADADGRRVAPWEASRRATPS